MRTHMEWNVETHMIRARPPTSAATRSFISPAALFVKVIARIWYGVTSRSASRYAMRWVSTRVLPDPAPATMSSGPPWCTTAARCCGLSPASRPATSLRRARRPVSGAASLSIDGAGGGNRAGTDSGDGTGDGTGEATDEETGRDIARQAYGGVATPAVAAAATPVRT